MKKSEINFSKIKASDFKQAGFKSKLTARKFAQLLNIKTKGYENASDYLKVLETKLQSFKKIGMDFNESLKNMDTSSSKVKENRIKKQENKIKSFDTKINDFLERDKKAHSKLYDITYFGGSPFYTVYNTIVKDRKAEIVEECSNHYLSFKKYKLKKSFDYKPWEKTPHTRKKTFVYAFDGNIETLTRCLYDIYNKQKLTFKITLQFSYLLISEVEKIGVSSIAFDIHYASTNTRLKGFENPVVVDNKKDINNIIDKVSKADLIEQFIKSRKDSSWKFYKFLDVEFHVYEMSTPIGKANELPIHFKEGSNEKALIKYENYDDYLCFWRCFAFHLTKPTDPRNVSKKLKSLFNDYYNYVYCKDGTKIQNHEVDIKSYVGVNYVAYDKEYSDERLDADDYDTKEDELDKIERHFKININVYTNDEPDILQIDRRSICKYEDTLNLMRYNNHFMYIKDLNQIRHCYRCKKCSKIFQNMEACNRHEKKCDELIKHTFPGGTYNKSKSIFDRIDKQLYNIGEEQEVKEEKECKGKKQLTAEQQEIKDDLKKTYLQKNYTIDENDKYYPFECAFDFEAMVKKISKVDDDKKLKIVSEHVPVSVSLFSNVPGYENKPIFLCSDKPEVLIDEFVKLIYNISQEALKINQRKFNDLINDLNLNEADAESLYEKYLKRYKDDTTEDNEKLVKTFESRLNHAKSLKKQFENWYMVLPVLSFNGSKYDINLMKQYLHKSLLNYGQVVDFAIKKANAYMSLKSQHLQFLDIRSYLAPNYSYDAFIKAYKCKLEKGFFPYDWFDSYDKINNTELPSHKCFYNKLKNTNITDEEYKICVNAWKDNNMKTFKDFLEWYNNLDVLPFIEAVEK